MKIDYSFFTLFFFLLSLFLSSCTSTKESDYSATSFYKPKYASKFFIDATVKNTFQLNVITDTDTITYTLANKVGDSEKSKITIPIQKGIFFSTTHLAYLNSLQALEVVQGFSNLDFISVDNVRKQLQKNNTNEVGEEFSVNNELLTMIDADFIASSGFGENTIAIDKPALPILEWKETHPLGRAEWIIVFGLLTGKFDEAVQLFKEIEKEYNKLKELVKSKTLDKPKVLVGFPYQGQWYAPGGNSFMSVFLEDAGANYPWKSIEQNASIVIDFEEVYKVGTIAPYWLIVGQINSLESVLGTDERFKDFIAFQQKKVFNNDKRLNTQGWSEYYETSVLLPHEVLADLIQIFHSELLPGRATYYHRALPEKAN